PEAYGRRRRRLPGERVTETLEPRLEYGVVGGEDAPRALEDPLPRAGREREGGEVFGRPRRADGRVVVPGPRLRRELRRRNQPADAQAGEAVRLRQPVHADQLVVAPPERRRGFPVALGARIHLVGQQPRPDFLGALENQAAHLVGEDVTG